MMLAFLVLLAFLATPARAQTGCCSLRELVCNSTFGTTYQSCVSQSWDTGKRLVWYPSGIPRPLPSCLRLKATCTSNDQCCGSNVCSGLGSSYKRKQCNHPRDVCTSFGAPTQANFCASRSECRWEAPTAVGLNGTCVPSFNYTFVDPATKPKTIPDDPGCCSDNHLSCNSWTWHLTTPEMCRASNPASVWLKTGSGAIANPQCYTTHSPVHCTKNDQCCGNLVCAPPAGNPVDLRCRSPSWVCPTYSTNTPAGIARCNAAPGCKWEAAKCVVAFNDSVFDAESAKVKATTVKEPVRVRSQLEGNPDRLGLCTGFVAFMHGDPHFNTFDRNYYDCQGTGAFVLAKAEGMMEIQGLFHQAGGGKASVTKGIAIEYPALPGVPRIQISMNETANRADDTTYMINNDCAAHIFLDGELKPARRNNSYSSVEQSYAMRFSASGAIEIQFFNGTKNSTAIHVSVSGTPNTTFGCFMNIRTCLPLNEPELRAKTIGILGTPNGNIEDEWKGSDGKVVPVSGVAQEQYKYCTTHHCVMDRFDSLFIYEGKSFQDLWSCNAEFPGEPDLANAPKAILDLCQGRADCIMEGVLGGINAAIRNAEEQKLIIAIQTSNKTVEAAKFEITPVRPMSCVSFGVVVVWYSGTNGVSCLHASLTPKTTIHVSSNSRSKITASGPELDPTPVLETSLS